MADRPVFELGLVMAGAISAGAYTAGVMDFIIEALDAYEAAKLTPGWDGPTHDVRVPVMAGASAGGMTSAISALQAFHEIEHVRAVVPPPPPEKNRLYSSWVRDIDLKPMLATSDLDTDAATGVKSVLDCSVLETIVENAFRLSGPPKARNWLGRGDDPSLRVLLTLTNLRGVPYSLQIFGANIDDYAMLNHGDYLDFTVGIKPTAVAGSYALDICDTTTPNWEVFKKAALATGAFPVGLAPRLISRPTADYWRILQVGFQDSAKCQFVPIPPNPKINAADPYEFVAVDGGTIDNEPLEIGRRILEETGRGARDGLEARKAIILIAPFPSFAELPQLNSGTSILEVLPQLMTGLIQQARFKPEELAMAVSDKVFSRFLISPIRPAPPANEYAVHYPIASGTLGGFGGFIDESFRRHDYLLGRRNAQAFLRWNFALPEHNSLFDGPPINRDKWCVRNASSQTGDLTRADESKLEYQKFLEYAQSDNRSRGLPIIPLCDSLCVPIQIGHEDLPKPDEINFPALQALIETRAGKVIANFVDVGLEEVTKSISFGGLLRWPAVHYLTQIATKKAGGKVSGAIQDVEEAFRTMPPFKPFGE